MPNIKHKFLAQHYSSITSQIQDSTPLILTSFGQIPDHQFYLSALTARKSVSTNIGFDFLISPNKQTNKQEVDLKNLTMEGAAISQVELTIKRTLKKEKVLQNHCQISTIDKTLAQTSFREAPNKHQTSFRQHFAKCADPRLDLCKYLIKNYQNWRKWRAAAEVWYFSIEILVSISPTLCHQYGLDLSFIFRYQRRTRPT